MDAKPRARVDAAQHAAQPPLAVRDLLEAIADSAHGVVAVERTAEGESVLRFERRKAELIGFLKALAMEPESEAVFRKAKAWAGRPKRRPARG